MKNLKKTLVLIVFVVALCLLTSCNGYKQLEKALEEVNKSASTIEFDLEMKMEMSYGSQSFSQTIVMQTYMETDQTHAYYIMTVEDQKIYQYVKIEEDYAKVYQKTTEDGEWELSETVSKDEYVGENQITSFDEDIEELFVEEDGIWVGNTELITSVLEDYMDSLTEDLVGTSGVTIEETSVKKYNITLTDKKISNVDIEMYTKLSQTSPSFPATKVTMEITFSMPMKFSKIGETTVTVPENLPIE